MNQEYDNHVTELVVGLIKHFTGKTDGILVQNIMRKLSLSKEPILSDLVEK